MYVSRFRSSFNLLKSGTSWNCKRAKLPSSANRLQQLRFSPILMFSLRPNVENRSLEFVKGIHSPFKNIQDVPVSFPWYAVPMWSGVKFNQLFYEPIVVLVHCDLISQFSDFATVGIRHSFFTVSLHMSRPLTLR